MAIYDVLVWDLSQISVTGASDYPFPDNATGEKTSDVAGAILTISESASAEFISVEDNDSIFDDGDGSQDLVNATTLNGVYENAGDRFTPEYAYTIQDVETGEVITIYSVELGGNDQVAIVSDAPLTAGASYEFIARVDKHPDVAYSDLATTEGSTDNSGNSGNSDGVVDGSDSGEYMGYGYSDSEGDEITPQDDVIRGNDGDDSIDGLEGDDVIEGGYGDDYIYGNEGDDVIVGTSFDSLNGTGSGSSQLSVTIASQSGDYNGSVLAEITGSDGNVETVELTDDYDANVGGTLHWILTMATACALALQEMKVSHGQTTAAMHLHRT